MRQWVHLSPATTDACTAYLNEARKFVAGLVGIADTSEMRATDTLSIDAMNDFCASISRRDSFQFFAGAVLRVVVEKENVGFQPKCT